MASKQYLHDIDLAGNSLKKAAMDPLAAAPASPVVGQTYFDTTLGKPRWWNGATWADWSAATGSTDITTVASPTGVAINSSSGADATFPLADGTNAGAMAPGDFTKLGALPTAATLASDLALKAPLASPTFTGTPVAPTVAGSDSSTQIANMASVQAAIDLKVTGLFDLKGSIDASTNPNYTASSLKGDAYVVTVAGKVGGASGVSVDVGDVVVATADNAGGTQAAVGSSWTVLEHNLVGALLSANNLSDVANAATARSNLGAMGRFAQNIGGATTIAVTHNLGSKDVSVTLRDVATDAEVSAYWVATDANNVTFTFSPSAPAAASLRAVVIG